MAKIIVPTYTFTAMKLWMALVLIAVTGCVERTMTLKSDPPGALVYVNDIEVGRTPISHDFVWYGTYDVQLRMAGYETLDKKQNVMPPIYLWPGIDLIAEVLPVRVHDHHEFSYDLKAATTRPTDAEELLKHGDELKKQLESSRSAKK